MHIWLIKLEEMLPIDDDYRPYRTGMLASALLARGHTVTRWASDYNHYTHQYRFGKNSRIQLNDNYFAMLLYSGIAYSSAVSWKRLLDNHLLSREYRKEARKLPAPDMIVCSMPTPELAAVSADIACSYNVPLVVDARDMWPDVIASEMRGIKSLLSWPVILWMKSHLAKAAKSAVSLVGITPFYRDHLLHYAGRDKSELDGVFALGFDPRATLYDASEEQQLYEYWKSKGVDLAKDHVAYFAGRLNSTIYNTFHHTLAAMQALNSGDSGIKVIYCGSGAYEDKIRDRAAGVQNMIFPGEVETRALAILREHAFAALLPVERRQDFQNSMSNKFFEYLSSGVPILSWLDGLPGQILEQHGCGYIYNSGRELADFLERLLHHPQEREAMGLRALELFNNEFDAHIVYEKYAIFLEDVKNYLDEDRLTSLPH